MIRWTGGADFVSSGDHTSLHAGFIDLERKDDDSYAVSFVSDINNRFVAYLTKAECEELSEKLKDIIKKPNNDD